MHCNFPKNEVTLFSSILNMINKDYANKTEKFVEKQRAVMYIVLHCITIMKRTSGGELVHEEIENCGRFLLHNNILGFQGGYYLCPPNLHHSSR